MTNPLNYQGSRMFPQDILNDLDKRLRVLEASLLPASKPATPQPAQCCHRTVTTRCEGCPYAKK